MNHTLGGDLCGCVKDEEIADLRCKLPPSQLLHINSDSETSWTDDYYSLKRVSAIRSIDRSNGRDRFGYGVTGAYYGVGHYSTLSGSHTKLPLWGLHERSNVAPAFLFVLQTTVLKDIELHPNLYHLSGVAPTDDSHRFDNQQLGSEELNPKKNERIKNNKSSCWPLVTEDVRDVRLGSRS